MIQLAFAKHHRSIVELPRASLPDFTVITGVNGSGKSHLLEAIENRSITVAGTANPGEIRRFDWNIVAPACEIAGYKSIRADEVKQTNLIHLDVLQKLIDSPMAICDLSSRNPNVLFELGLRQAFDKPAVLIQEVGTPKIFDIAPLRYCEYRKERVYHEVLEDQKSVAQAINATRDAKKESINSIVKLLSITKPAALPDIAETNKDPALQIIRAELSELRLDLRQAISVARRSTEPDRLELQRVRDLIRDMEFRIMKSESKQEAEALLIEAEGRIRGYLGPSENAEPYFAALKELQHHASKRFSAPTEQMKRRHGTMPSETQSG